MKFLASFFHRSPKSSKRNGFEHLLHRVGEHIAAIGMCMLLVLLLGVLLFDGLIFYINVVRQRQPPSANERKINLSEKNIADVLILLDARQKEFDEILNALTTTKRATSSIITQPEIPRVGH